MTKKLYLYNDICYDKCPYGSKNNDIDNTCVELNQYTSINESINANIFKKTINSSILNYLSEYANNSVDIKRSYDFSNYFYNQQTNESFKIELHLPIFYFSECIEKIKKKFNLYNNSIFCGIIEYNVQTNKNGEYNKNSKLVNSTEYMFFYENGTIIDYSICKGINIITKKKVEVNKIDINEIKEIQDKYNISVFNQTSIELNDYCIPFIIGNKDLTLYDRKLLFAKYAPPCDEGCSFISFNYDINYSTCNFPMKNDNNEKTIKEKIKEEINDIDYIKVLKDGNFKYLKCYRSLFNKTKEKYNWIKLISIIFGAIHVFFLLFVSFYNSKKKIINKNISTNASHFYNDLIKKKDNDDNINNSDRKNIIDECNNIDKKNIIDDNNKDQDTKTDHDKEKKTVNCGNKKRRNSAIIYISKIKEILNTTEKDDSKVIMPINHLNLKNKGKKEISINTNKFCNIFIITFIENSFFFTKKNKGQYMFLFFNLTLINLALNTLFFLNALLLSDEYISKRNAYKNNKNLEYILTEEYDRIIYSLLITLLIIKLFKWILKRLENRKKSILIIIYCLILLFHIFFIYFLVIFGNINPRIQLELFISTLVFIIIYMVLNVLESLIIAFAKRYCNTFYTTVKDFIDSLNN